jgi:hypothetical protein
MAAGRCTAVVRSGIPPSQTLFKVGGPEAACRGAWCPLAGQRAEHTRSAIKSSRFNPAHELQALPRQLAQRRARTHLTLR